MQDIGSSTQTRFPKPCFHCGNLMYSEILQNVLTFKSIAASILWTRHDVVGNRIFNAGLLLFYPFLNRAVNSI